MERFEEAFGIEVLGGYGLSETCAIGTFNYPGERRPGSIGKPVDGVEVKIVDDDRKKDMIIRGGENVYPREIEEVLYKHGAVAEVAVIGVEHERLGEEVAAAIVLKEGESASEDEIRDFALEKLAKYKCPTKLWFVDELPKGPTGKILKRELRPLED
jgi:long-chain acyl-CoA synthetase